MMRRMIWVVCLSFVVALGADTILFALIDPVELKLLSRLLGVSRMVSYMFALVVLWLLVGGLSAWVCYLRRPTAQGAGSPSPV